MLNNFITVIGVLSLRTKTRISWHAPGRKRQMTVAPHKWVLGTNDSCHSSEAYNLEVPPTCLKHLWTPGFGVARNFLSFNLKYETKTFVCNCYSVNLFVYIFISCKNKMYWVRRTHKFLVPSILPFPHTIHLYQTLPTFPNSHLRNCMATFALTT